MTNDQICTEIRASEAKLAELRRKLTNTAPSLTTTLTYSIMPPVKRGGVLFLPNAAAANALQFTSAGGRPFTCGSRTSPIVLYFNEQGLVTGFDAAECVASIAFKKGN